MPSFTLPRTGSAPVKIDGERIGYVETTSTKSNDRCSYTLSIYRLTDGRLCYHCGYRTSWPHERPYDWAVVVPSESALIAALEDVHYPVDYGWPAGKNFAEQNAKLERQMESHYRAAVQRALEQCGFTVGADAAEELTLDRLNEAIERRIQLHEQVRLFYVVDGYVAALSTDDGNTEKEFKGETPAEALALCFGCIK